MAVVSQYQHMGGIVNGRGDIRPEITRRTGEMYSAFRKMRRPVFKNEALAVPVRMNFVVAFMDSKLLYNSHTWSCIPETEMRRLNAAYVAP
eukprot:1776848-Alexandrium_andersonii.AAC.1